MAKKNTENGKLIALRLVLLIGLALLLVKLEIVTDTMSGSILGLYIFSLLLALPLTMVLDKYIVRFLKAR